MIGKGCSRWWMETGACNLQFSLCDYTFQKPFVFTPHVAFSMLSRREGATLLGCAPILLCDLVLARFLSLPLDFSLFTFSLNMNRDLLKARLGKLPQLPPLDASSELDPDEEEELLDSFPSDSSSITSTSQPRRSVALFSP